MVSPTRLKTYIKFGVSSGMMIALETWGFEIITIIVAFMKDTTLMAAHAICFGYLFISFILPLSISIASSTRVGNLLGEGKHRIARITSMVGVTAAATLVLINAITFLLIRNVAGYLYTNDEAVVVIVASIMPIAAGTAFFDAIQVSLGGVLRGTGRPGTGTILNIIGFYVIGLSLYLGLGFGANMRLTGVWVGLLSALGFLAFSYGAVVLRLDYKKESIAARLRSEVPAEGETEKFLEMEENKGEGKLVTDTPDDDVRFQIE